MSTARTPLARRITAGLGIAALATAALFGGMVPASAADAGNIVPDAPKSLTIHKHAQPATLGTPPNGLQLVTPPANPLNGVTFQIQKVNSSFVDLSTNAGWAKTVGLTPAGVAGQLGAATTGVTNASGIATFAGLDQAVYLVTETNPGTNNIAFAAQPFLVTLPLPNNSDNTWIYGVHVYPKNSLASITKTVDDSAAKGLGSDVKWNMAAPVPNASQGNVLTSFAIEDVLDPRLTYKSATATLSSGTAIASPADYTVVPAAGTVRINFTAAGLLKLTPGTTVNVALITAVTSLGNTSGIILNDASVYINDKKTTSTKVQSNWGNVIISKVSAGTPTRLLEGAKFKVYASESDAQNDANAISVTSAGVTTDVFTSDTNGRVNIAGLRAKLNGAGADITYWLVETEAPAGYTIAADVSKATPKSFTVNSEIATTVDITVANPQTVPFTLPLTGGPGTVAFMIVGLGLLSIAGGLALRKRSTRRVSQV